MKFLQTIGRFDVISARQRKKFIWKACELLKFTDKEFITDFFGLKYKGHTKNHIDRYVYFLGAYERGMLAFIEETLKKSDKKVFVDIGANVGHHSIFASKFASKVFSFEPYSKVRASLEEKIKLNDIQNIQICPFALGTTDEELPFFEPPDFNTGTGTFIQDFRGITEHKGLTLSIRNGEKMFNELGIKDIGLIKIDVEGFEASVLNGLLPILKKEKPIIVMEHSPESKKLFSELTDVKKFLLENYDMRIFSNPNKINYRLSNWDMEKCGDIVLTPKSS